MAATTANDIIKRSMVKARIITPGAAIPAGKANQALEELNDFLESWALEKLMVIANVEESFTLVVGTAEYTYGAAGTFASARPIEIMDETFIRSGSVDHRCKLVSPSIYRGKSNKTSSGRPRILTYNPEYPLMAVSFYPTPSAADDVYFKVAKDITSFALLTTSVDLAPGYRRAIVSNFGVELCVSYGKKISPALAHVARESKKVIKAINSVQKKQMTTPHLTAMAGGGRGMSALDLFG